MTTTGIAPEHREFSVHVPDMDLPPADGVNYFHITRVGIEVEFLVGTVPLFALAKAAQDKSGNAIELPFQVRHRYLMSIASLVQLGEKVNQILTRTPEPLKANAEDTP